MKGLWEAASQALIKIKVQSIHYPLLVHSDIHLILESKEVRQA